MPEAYENYVLYNHSNNAVLSVNETMNDVPMDTAYHDLTGLNITHFSNLTTCTQLNFHDKPRLKILVQPADKFRFRYITEMSGSHGNLGGDGNSRKSVPRVKLENYNGSAFIRCTLVTANEAKRMPHAHRLVRKEGNQERDDPHDIEVSMHNDYTAVFQGMGIIHTAKKNVKEELLRKLKQAYVQNKYGHQNINLVKFPMKDELQLNTEAENAQKNMNLNSVALCFRAFRINNNTIEYITDSVYTHQINNLKSALTGELKICRIDRTWGSCDGNEEIFIFVEKVGKKNIKIKFFELDNNDKEIWCGYGKFNEPDVHHQYAIAFKTPPYKDLNIIEDKTVYLKLERPTDASYSNCLQFTYKPSKRNTLTMRKRLRMSNSNSFELSNENKSVEKSNTNKELNITAELSQYFLRDYQEDDEFHQFITSIFTNSDNVTSEDIRQYEDLQFDGMHYLNDESFLKSIMKKIIITLKDKSNNVNQKLKHLFMERTRFGDTILHSLIRYENYDDVQRILTILGRMTQEYSSEIVNLQNSMDETPLHLAVLINRSEIVESLLLLGADVSIKDMRGLNPLEYAVECKETFSNKMCIDLLLSKYKDNSNISHLLISAIKCGSYHAVIALINFGVDVNVIDMSSGKTALHLAIEGQHKNIIEYLLKQKKIDINKETYAGNTALDYAVMSDCTWKQELVECLKDLGAEPSTSKSNVASENIGAFGIDFSAYVKDEIESNDEDENEDNNDDIDSEKLTSDLAENKLDVKQLLLEASLSDCRIKDEIHYIDEKTITEISSILDKTRGWVKLAEKTGVHYLIPLLNDSKESSPSLRVINYALENDFTPNLILIILREIGETEAAEKLSEVL